MMENLAQSLQELTRKIKEIKEYVPEFMQKDEFDKKNPAFEEIDVEEPFNHSDEEGLTDYQKEMLKEEYGWSEEEINNVHTWEHAESMIEKGEKWLSETDGTDKNIRTEEVSETITEIGNKSGIEKRELSNEKEDVNEIPQVTKNKLDGCERENQVEKELREQYPESEGYQIIKEAFLRDKDGNYVLDPETGKRRRIDFVVVKDGKVVKSVEVTSLTAPKENQMAKEKRIREAGGNYILDKDGNLVEFPDEVETEIERRQ